MRILKLWAIFDRRQQKNAIFLLVLMFIGVIFETLSIAALENSSGVIK